MTAEPDRQKPSHLVLVVGVDLSDVSEHLLTQTHALIRPVDETEIHVVHVVRPDPFRQRIVHPLHSDHIGARSPVDSANWELQRLCASLLEGPHTHVVVHTPIGDVVDELTSIAVRTRADILVVEAHERDGRDGRGRTMFHRSAVARIARRAPCTVLTLRRPSGRTAEETAKPPCAEPDAVDCKPKRAAASVEVGRRPLGDSS
jgi:nucleotide-binding universal stress UspA family protein